MQSTTITIGGEEITLRELSWRESLTAGRKIGDSLLGFATKDGKFDITAEKLSAAISQNEELLSWLFIKCTDKKAEWVDSLSARDAIALLDLIVQMYLNEQFFAGAKALGSRVTAAIKLQKPSTN